MKLVLIISVVACCQYEQLMKQATDYFVSLAAEQIVPSIAQSGTIEGVATESSNSSGQRRRPCFSQ